MAEFVSNGLKIHFTDEGAGPPILLIHGFASSLDGNWKLTGVIDALVKDGRRVIAIDNRGHGKSDKPLDPTVYGIDMMAADSIALLDHLGIEQADVMGYSMGGYITTNLITEHPKRFKTAIIGGAGERVITAEFDEVSTQIADALDSDSGASDHPVAKMFRIFAQSTGGNLKALAAVMRSSRPRVDRAKLADVRIPVFVIAGASDPLVGDPAKFAAAIPGAEVAVLPGDHISVFGGHAYRDAVVAFLRKRSPVGVA
ncbi:MAG: alpha/beta hydrolase [Chloroflexota bacterium]